MTAEINYLSTDTHTAIEALWTTLAHDPQQRALTVTRLCLDHAPHLVEWVQNKIVNSMSDALLKTLLFATPGPVQDGRLVALNALAEYKAGRAPERPPTAIPNPAKSKPRRKSRRSAERAAIATFESLFNTTLEIAPTREEKPIRVDWELGRLSIPLYLAHQFRLWVLARDITRNAEGSGVVTRRALWEKLRAYRITCTKRHFNRLLVAGQGLFWYNAGKKLYLAGCQPVACAMTRMARAQDIPTESNLPGNRDVLLDPSGSLEQWEGMLYAGWMTGREAKGKSSVTISRATLARLFGRDETTLRRWEENRLTNILTIRHNIAHCVEDESDLRYIPAHAQPYLARIRTSEGVTQEVRLMWQIPNSYHADLPMHPHNGQASKVRRAIDCTNDPADIMGGGKERRYYPSPKTLKARQRSRKFRMGLLGDVSKRVYVFLGTQRRSRRGVFEYTANAMPITRPTEREAPKREAIYFATEGVRVRQFWDARREALMD